VFWHVHDPTQLNRQGPDVGTQYRSGIYTCDAEQFQQAERSKMQAEVLFKSPIVTEIVPADVFWKAEEYHQDYLRKNPWRAACHAVPDLKAILASMPV
jgi:peptide-methionine (S)-S-oxide reductase